jgi:hypothetical protein
MPDNIEELNDGHRPEDTPPAEVVVEQQPATQEPTQEVEAAPAEPPVLAMSDEDFLKQGPALLDKVPEKTEEKSAETPGEEPKPQDKVTEKGAEPASPGSAEGKPADQKPAQEAQVEAPARPDQKGLENFYDVVMGPIKANGKEITLKSPEEARQLIQMGANYTRKMQELAPHRKVVQMLANNNIDESRLNFLIDLDKKDPEAIKKLIMDSGIDPLDIDTKTESAYRAGSHQISDQEVAFTTQMDELESSDEGKATLNEIGKNWDKASKDELYHDPGIMAVIHQQREAGIYAIITTEMERQKTLGQIAPTKSFIEAYKEVGDQLYAAGKFGPPAGSQGNGAGNQSQTPGTAAQSGQEPAPKPVPEVVTTRAATPKPSVTNNDKVAAAAPTRTTPGGAKEVTNFLSMSDEEFQKLNSFNL